MMTTLTADAPGLKKKFGQKSLATTDSRFRVARNLDEVLAAWRVVYDVYVKSGLIHPNPYSIHTTPQSISQQSAVFHSISGQSVESTLTAIVDGPLGVPMDTVYETQINSLRRKGRKLTECGLFAHVRQVNLSTKTEAGFDAEETSLSNSSARVQCSVVQLMRLALYFALAHGSEDSIVGVHPRHAPFYARAFGFRQCGPIRTCPTVNHRPVVLLHANLRASLQMNPVPFVLSYCLANPVDSATYDDRYCFHPGQIAEAPGNGIHAYLHENHMPLRRAAC